MQRNNPNRRSRVKWLTCAAIPLALLLAGCSAGGGDGAEAESKDPVSLTFATGGGLPPNEMQAAIFSPTVIKEASLANYGKDYDLKILTTKGTSEAQTLLVSGQAQIGTVSFGTFATMQSKNAVPGGLSIIAGQYLDGYKNKVSNPFMVLESSGIKSAADLKGKTLGVNAVGSAVDVALRVWLKDQGIDPEKDVSFAEIPFGAQGAALREGKIDLGSFVPPFAAIERSTGGVKTLFTEADALGGENAAIVIAARNDFLKANPDAVKAFLADWVKGLQWLSADENREGAIKLMSEITKAPVANLELFYGTPDDYFRDLTGCPSGAALQVGIQGMVKAGYLAKSVEVAPHVQHFLPAGQLQVITNTFGATRERVSRVAPDGRLLALKRRQGGIYRKD